MIGGKSAVDGDVLPYGLAMGNRAKLVGLNLVGLRRLQVIDNHHWSTVYSIHGPIHSHIYIYIYRSLEAVLKSCCKHFATSLARKTSLRLPRP